MDKTIKISAAHLANWYWACQYVETLEQTQRLRPEPEQELEQSRSQAHQSQERRRAQQRELGDTLSLLGELYAQASKPAYEPQHLEQCLQSAVEPELISGFGPINQALS